MKFNIKEICTSFIMCRPDCPFLDNEERIRKTGCNCFIKNNTSADFKYKYGIIEWTDINDLKKKVPIKEEYETILTKIIDLKLQGKI